MSTDSARGTAPARNGRVECTLNTDPRLISAVGTIVANAAQRAGLPEGEQRDVGAAAVETCLKMFPPNGDKESTSNVINLLVTDFPDRVDVIIDAAVKAPLTTSPAGTACAPLEDLKSERVHCEKGEGRVKLTLLKPCGEPKSSPKV